MDQEIETFIVVPKENLSSDALLGLVEEYILREGTDYGHSEVTLEQKRQQILSQLNHETIQIVFGSTTQNCTLMLKTDSAIPPNQK